VHYWEIICAICETSGNSWCLFPFVEFHIKLMFPLNKLAPVYSLALSSNNLIPMKKNNFQHGKLFARIEPLDNPWLLFTMMTSIDSSKPVVELSSFQLFLMKYINPSIKGTNSTKQ